MVNETYVMWGIAGVIGLLVLIILFFAGRTFFRWLFDIRPKPESQIKILYQKLKGKLFRIKQNNDGSWGTSSYGVNVSATSPEGVIEKLQKAFKIS